MAPHLNPNQSNPSDAEYLFRTSTGSFARGWQDEMTHNLPTTAVLKRLATRAAIGTCFVLAMGVLVAAVRGEAKSIRSTGPSVVAVEPVAVEAMAFDVVPNTNAELAAAHLHPETPVNGRELLHDHLDVAPATRVEVTPRPASPAASTKTLAATPKTKTIEMEVTAYCACKKCCGPKAQGITAS